MRLVDLNCNFECDWLIELSDDKLSDNNLASELVENRSFLVIFMIKTETVLYWHNSETFMKGTEH